MKLNRRRFGKLPNAAVAVFDDVVESMESELESRKRSGGEFLAVENKLDGPFLLFFEEKEPTRLKKRPQP
jgi:hypothetical protein